MNDSVFLIISKRYSPGMSADKLRETTCGNWKLEGEIREQRERLQYALAVVRTEVKEVYKIHPGSWGSVGDGRWKFSGEVASEDIRTRCIGRRMTQISYGRAVIHCNLEEFMAEHENSDSKKGMTDSIIDNALGLLPQFYQIIFHGPPGTGKTRAAKQVLKSIFGLSEDDDDSLKNLQGEGEKDQWDIVQFHPSYNYEDFVRGVQVETTPSGQVAYKTLDRAFGEMCRKANAKKNRSKKFALIIDEINRANVSAVLGELIYALEYRGHSVNTPYDAGGGKALTIPKNLYIIGTMNTADRTIGQIDYAVRRRFAFVPCPPDEEVVYKKGGEKVWEIYDKTQRLFRKTDNGGFLSSDFDAADVCIGHSYFLPSDERAKNSLHQIAQKIIWQVVPILHEYVKDGVLQDSENIQKAIAEIKKAAENLPKKSSAGESEKSGASAYDKSGAQFYRWKRNAHEGFDKAARVWLAIVRDYVKTRKPKNLQSLMDALSAPKGSIREESTTNARTCYMQDVITLADNSRVVVSYHTWTNPDKFADTVKKFGYQINLCHIVNIGEGKKPGGQSRRWELCSEHNFVSAGGKGYVAQLSKLKKGDFIFVNLVDTADKAGGVVACGEVISEKSVAIGEFSTAQGPLLSILVEDGQTYGDRFPHAISGGKSGPEYCEHVVAVKWIREPRKRDNGVKISSPRSVSRQDRISEGDFIKLKKAFNLGNEKRR